MSDKWVVNASPLILLAKIGRIELLSQLTVQLIVPASVVDEISRGPEFDPARHWLAGTGSGIVVPDPIPAQAVAGWDLGAGETAVLTWALQQPDFEAIIDDRAARKCAGINGILFRGTLGVVLAARERGLIPAAKPLCDDLLNAGLLIDRTLLGKALLLVGE